MTNHVHIIGVPENEQGLANFIGRAHFRYSQSTRFTGAAAICGRGDSIRARWTKGILATRCVTSSRVPVLAKRVRKAWRYPWSSAVVPCGTVRDDGLLDLAWWRETLGDEARW